MDPLKKLQRFLFPYKNNKYSTETPNPEFSGSEVLSNNELLKKEKAVLEKVEKVIKIIENKKKRS
ncbi:hypothetical protein [uncultured Winogradskyella sp.]|uniref:hypothetical protein n=1 Tax=uncultured Winogradskyella sp. TaxID=395353 RepID=UPI00261EAB7C|nr:hypothetical protein [uncultured Winogradskyella sp.]